MAPYWLMMETFVAPVETSKSSRERRKEKMGVNGAANNTHGHADEKNGFEGTKILLGKVTPQCPALYHLAECTSANFQIGTVAFLDDPATLEDVQEVAGRYLGETTSDDDRRLAASPVLHSLEDKNMGSRIQCRRCFICKIQKVSRSKLNQAKHAPRIRIPGFRT
jgi:hypothetical protein